MFGENAPIWPFLVRFGGAADPQGTPTATMVIETYPVLFMITLGWMLPDKRATGRLPKYNPGRRKTFSIADWQHVCKLTSEALGKHGLTALARWIDSLAAIARPQKADQDGLDACVCLLVALSLVGRDECLMVGDQSSGYIVVPHSALLAAELEQRCKTTGRMPSDWVRPFRLAVTG